MDNNPENKTVTTDCFFQLSGDLKIVTVKFTCPASPSATLRLDAQNLDNLLQKLGACRAAMKPEVPESLPGRLSVQAITDPKWFTEPERLNGDSVIHLRDPRFGWLHYILPRAMATKLASTLQKQATAPLPLDLKKVKAN